MQISEISARIEQLQYELNVENQRGMVKDSGKVANLEAEIAELNKQIENQKQADIEASVTTEVTKFMDTLDFEGVDPKDIFLNYSEEKAIASYNYVNAVIQNAVAKMKQAELAKENALEATISALQDKNEKLQQEKEELSHDLSVQNLEVSDLTARLANATRLLDEEKAEVERLNSQVDDLRKEIAIGAAAATKVEEVDLRSAHEKWLEQRQKEEDAKPVIYNIRWKDDLRRDTYLAELAENDETIEIPYYAMNGDIINNKTGMKGKYRVVTSEEAPSFRTSAAVNEEDYAYDIPVGSEVTEYTAPAFRSEEESTESAASGLATETPAVVGSTVTREEFEELKARVAQIEYVRSVA